jgi:hypothetical protein
LSIAPNYFQFVFNLFGFFSLHGSPLYCVIFSWRVICYLKFILRYYHKLYIFYISVRVERERLSIPPCYFQLLYYLTPKVLIFYISVLNFFFLALMLIIKYWDMKKKIIDNKKRENEIVMHILVKKMTDLNINKFVLIRGVQYRWFRAFIFLKK